MNMLNLMDFEFYINIKSYIKMMKKFLIPLTNLNPNIIKISSYSHLLPLFLTITHICPLIPDIPDDSR